MPISTQSNIRIRIRILGDLRLDILDDLIVVIVDRNAT